MTVTIFHNPRCGTSRTVLAEIRAAGIEPEIVEYLKTPPDRVRLLDLLRRLDIGPRALLRRKEPIHAELGLDDESLSDERLIEAMAAHPILIERPIVIADKGARICRPAGRLSEIL